jgi:hypothetical protein
MLKNNKLPCSNISTESYTGKEQSPKRFGLSAEGFEVNHEKEGFDGKIWVVQYKNNRKVWVRKNIISIVTHEEPLINDDNTTATEPVIENPIINSSVIINNEITEEPKEEELNEEPKNTDKKKTDYNIFVKYYLDKLKKEDTNKTPNKVLFQQTTQEWARLKKNPNELKLIMGQLKK